MTVEKCSREEDKAFGGIVLWLLVTDQEAHVDRHGNVTLRRSRWAARREKRRNGARAMALAEEKRRRKAAKRKGL